MISTSLSQVRERIRRFTDGDSDPKLEEKDLDVLVSMCRRVDLFGNPPDMYEEWEADTHFDVGQAVVPPGRTGDEYTPIVRNGYYYTALVQGDTGTVEPAWPKVIGNNIVDNEVTWTCSGRAPWNPIYDVNYAIAQGWLLKSGRLVGHYNFMTGGRMFSREQFYNHCMDQYKRFSAKAGIKAIRLGQHSPLSASVAGWTPTNAD